MGTQEESGTEDVESGNAHAQCEWRSTDYVWFGHGMRRDEEDPGAFLGLRGVESDEDLVGAVLVLRVWGIYHSACEYSSFLVVFKERLVRICSEGSLGPSKKMLG